jgi:hypothetical protein
MHVESQQRHCIFRGRFLVERVLRCNGHGKGPRLASSSSWMNVHAGVMDAATGGEEKI